MNRLLVAKNDFYRLTNLIVTVLLLKLIVTVFAVPCYSFVLCTSGFLGHIFPIIVCLSSDRPRQTQSMVKTRYYIIHTLLLYTICYAQDN